MNNQQKQPFDPWTATEEEAVKEDQIRAKIKENLSAERRKLETGSDGWFEIQYKLAPICIEAIRQRKAAIRIKKYREKADRLSELNLLAIMQEVMNFKLIAPDWLTLEFSRRLNPILLGEKVGFDGWSTGCSSVRLKRIASGLGIRLYEIVNELLAETDEKGRPRYTKSRLDVENNVWEPAAARIEEEFKGIQKKFSYSGGTARRDYKEIKDMIEKTEIKKVG